MYRFFRSKLERDAEDMVQQTFLTCVRNRDAFRGDSSFRTYLRRAVEQLRSFVEDSAPEVRSALETLAVHDDPHATTDR